MVSESDRKYELSTSHETKADHQDGISAVDTHRVSDRDFANNFSPSSSGDTSQKLQENSPARMLPSIQQDRGTNKAHKTRLFGLAQEKRPQGYAPLDDYEQRYPPDEFGQEMGPGARVWRVYLDEAELFDRDMVEGWKDGIDVLLVFAGLFSAVVTTFVAQTSTKLDIDYGQVSASLLTELIAIQRAIATATSLDQIPPSELNFSSPPQYTKSDAWVNGLWFTSLALSLSTALFAVLIKQWIQHYTSFISGSPLERARIHQFRYSGLEQWGVRAIIGVLPLLLYMALFLFILGLAIFLRALKPEIAYVVMAIGGSTFISYVVTNGLPVLYPQCPYQTPLVEYIYTVVSLGLICLRRLPLLFFLLLYRLVRRIKARTRRYMVLDRIERWCKTILRKWPSFKLTALKTLECKAAQLEPDKKIQEIIEWLLTVSSNPSVKSIALQSISGLPAGFSRIREMFFYSRLVRRELDDEFKRQESIAKTFGNEPVSLADSVQFYNAERIVRASIFASIDGWNGDRFTIFPTPVWKPLCWEDFARSSPSPDQNPAFWKALTTYRVLSVSEDSSDTPTTLE